ncbi:MAG: hypothetical protein C5B54_02965 [Acidobacteria bacterium]|nr:MAG: hypothetical protein C5B54_02965 [Acidobacteriota bacterium]
MIGSRLEAGGPLCRQDAGAHLRIAIVGLGQVGGSLALALRKSKIAIEIIGIDVSSRRLRLLKETLDHSSSNWKDAEKCDLIFLCMHFQQIVKFLDQTRTDSLLVDVCSGKEKIISQANRRKLRFIGGHPMAGNEREGERGWDAALFDKAPFFLCPGKFSKRSDLTQIKKLIQLIHANPIVVNPQQHDEFVALTSHLPAFLSVAYRDFSNSVPASFQGPGYKSFTRLAQTSPQLLKTFRESNARNITKQWKKWLGVLKRKSVHR